MLPKILIVLVLVVIVASLGSALFYLVKDGDRRSPRTVRALTLRIGLSIALFLALLLGYALGFLRPHGLRPDAPSAPAQTTPPDRR
ncbi:MAG: twin transmembrane helix small protein [Methylococcus sp.]|nr:twin transmembrane helix small protein [Methylococcus sp.]